MPTAASPEEHLWRNFSNHGFDFVKKWWKTNFWRAALQPQKLQNLLGHCLVTAVHMRTFQEKNHQQYDQMIEFCVKRSSTAHKMEALKIVAKTNATDLLKYFTPHLKNTPVVTILNIAADHKHWSIVQALQHLDTPQNPINATLKLAAQCGNLEVVKTLQDYATLNQMGQALRAASHAGHTAMVEHLLSMCDNRDVLPALVDALQRDWIPIVELLAPLLSLKELEIAKSEALKGVELDFSVKNRYPSPSTIASIDQYIFGCILHQAIEEDAHIAPPPPKRKM